MIIIHTNLACDVFVGQTDDQTILRRVIFVLVLDNQTFTGVVVGFTFTTPLEFDLITLKVLLVLDNFNETLKVKSIF